MKRIAYIFICALMLIATPAWGADNSTKRERNLIRQGNELYGQGKYHEALENFEKALVLNPSSYYALYNKACALVKLASDDNKGTANDPRKVAAGIFEQVGANTDVPLLAEYANYNLGNMAFNDNEFDRAINAYKAALRINPNNRKARQNLLLALQRKEQQQNQQQQDQQQQDQQQQDQQQQQQQQQQDQQQQDQQQQQQPQMSQNSEQILQSVQNKENVTRQRERRPVQGRPSTDKPW